MWKFAVLLICLSGYCLAGPVGPKRNMPIMHHGKEAPEAESADTSVDHNEMMIMSSLSLPSNATSIRADITDRFSCENKTYGYYADVDNDCQIFHVCLPVTYANGKENTFRWSFICPEETIFSQDSFTCMRPDDMTISCEESYQYYELNRNFGVVDSAGDKENSNEGSANAPAESNESVAVAEATKPLAQAEEEKVVEKYKPVIVNKPSRRKPTTSYATQKKPTSSYPLRKMPHGQTSTQMIESPVSQHSEVASQANKQAVEVENKPAVQKFSRRPVSSISNIFNDKHESAKTESVISPRPELFNQMRKRPTLFVVKKPAEQPEEEKVEQSKVEFEEANQPNFSAVASVMPIPNSDTQLADIEIEASESNHVFVKPEAQEEINESSNAGQEPVQVLEAFEEIPAIISEVVEIPKAGEEEIYNEAVINETSKIADEPQITEEVQSDEEIFTRKETQALQQNGDDIQKQAVEETPFQEEAKTVEEHQMVEEAETAPEEAAEVQQSLRTSAEENHDTEVSKIAEESQSEEKSKEPEDSHATQQVKVGSESQIPLETPVAEETQNAETQEHPVKIQAVEELQPVKVSLMDDETPAIVKIQPAEETQTAEETHALEEEVHDIHQILRTSAEQVSNSADEIPVVKPDQGVETENSPSGEFKLEEQEVPTNGEIQDVKAAQGGEAAKTIKETQAVQEFLKNEESKEYEEQTTGVKTQQNDEAVPSKEALVIEEYQPVVEKIEEAHISEESASFENSKPVDEMVESDQVLATKDSDLVNSEEGNVNVAPVETLEQMESEKPAETPESMQATEEMSHSGAMINEMYDNMDKHKQTLGGFKPVDPVMAHEAEQLIVDFINTLRKNDFTNETPGMQHMEQQSNEVAEEEQSHKSTAEEMEESENVKNSDEAQAAAVKIEEEEDKDKTPAEINETPEDKNEVVHDVEESKQDSELVSEEVNESNNFKSLETQEEEAESQKSRETVVVDAMYRFPVQVITTPVQQMSLIEEQSHEGEIEATEITAQEEEAPNMLTAGHKPLSIDDIVELVKERLDHMPKKEMENPMNLEEVLGEAHEDKTVVEEKSEEQTGVQEKQEEHQEQQQAIQSEEAIVMPIYQRTVQPAQIDAAAQTEYLEHIRNEEQSKVADNMTDDKEKTKRSYRSRSVPTRTKDSRKRRFLFKTDSS